MKRIESVLIILMLQILSSGLLCAQNNQTGLDLGFGRTKSRALGNLPEKNYKDISTYLRVGIVNYYTMPTSIW